MRRLTAAGLAALAVLSAVSPASAFYIPGWSIRSYKKGEQIPLLVNKVYSDNTQLQYAYYDLPFVCGPTGRPHSDLFSGQSIPLNLGEVLRGDRIRTSDVDLVMGSDTECAALCALELDRPALGRAAELVADGYAVEWILDNLPGATPFVSVDKRRKYYAAGFKLGSVEYPPATTAADPADPAPAPRLYLNNHHTIVVRYRPAPGRAGARGGNVIVGFEVYPKSIAADAPRDDNGCPTDLQSVSSGFELPLPGTGSDDDGGGGGETATVPYTYSVFFREDRSVEWATRWDLYFVNQEDGARIHWLAIINSLVICALLTAVVAVILARTIRAEIGRHRDPADEEGRRGAAAAAAEKKSGGGGPLLGDGDDAAETPSGGGGGGGDDHDHDDDDASADVAGWKLLHADVFRPPARGRLLAPLVGSGVQLLLVAACLVLLGALGVLNPSFRGGFVSVGAGLFVASGLLGGYFSARVFRTLDDNGSGSGGGGGGGGGVGGRRGWRSNALLTALLVPGLLFSLVLALNSFVWAQASSTAIPFGTLVALALLWLCVQVPLVYAGSRYGFARAPSWDPPPPRRAPASVPARPAPPRAWYAGPVPTALLAGLVPFAVVSIELLFVFRSAWQDKSGYYYVFGFLAAVSAILVVTVAEVTVVAVYAQLCAGDHRWWWRSFFVGGASAAWVFAYCAWYYVARLSVSGWVSGLMFFGYSFMACCAYGLVTGAVGFLSAYAFVRRIYGAIKVD